MKMMIRLLENLNRSWNKLAIEREAMKVSQGSGVHTLLTITSNQLYLHSYTFRSSLPSKQSIYMEELTIEELADTLIGMGYTVTFEGSIDTSQMCLTLLPVENVPITTAGSVYIYTSKLWKTLYPVARILEEADFDTDEAIKQMYATSTRGKWLDYWASFFNIKRLSGEDDKTMARRIFMTIVNLKTNNLAIEELLSYSFQTEARITDTEPAEFQVQVAPEFIAYKTLTDDIINSVKGAGIDFFYHYLKTLEENYPSYIKDKTGKALKDQDVHEVVLSGEVLFEPKYGYRWNTKTEDNGFDLNQDTLNSTGLDMVYMMDDSEFYASVDNYMEESKYNASEEWTHTEAESVHTEGIPQASEGNLLLELGSFIEEQFGYDPDGFGQYKLDDNLNSEVSIPHEELYDTMQEEVNTYFVALSELIEQAVDNLLGEVELPAEEESFRYRDSNQFFIGVNTLNSTTTMASPSTFEVCYMELTNADGTNSRFETLA